MSEECGHGDCGGCGGGCKPSMEKQLVSIFFGVAKDELFDPLKDGSLNLSLKVKDVPKEKFKPSQEPGQAPLQKAYQVHYNNDKGEKQEMCFGFYGDYLIPGELVESKKE